MKLISEIESGLGGWAIRWRWMVILVSVLLTLLASSGTAFLQFSVDHRVFFNETNPQLIDYLKSEDTYGKGDNIFLTIAPDDGAINSVLSLEAIIWLTEKSWQVPFASRVDSISNFQHTTADGDDILVRDLVDESMLHDPGVRAQIHEIALSDPRIAGRLYAHDGGAGGVNIMLEMPGEDAVGEGELVIEHVRELVEEARERFPSLDIRMIGMVMFNQTFMEASLSDLKTLLPISFILMASILIMLTGSLLGAIAVLLVVVLSVMTSVGIGGWVGLQMTSPSAVAPIVVLTVAIASCVHIFSTLTHHMRLGRQRTLMDRGSPDMEKNAGADRFKNDAIAESIRVNLQPVFLSSLTTTLGFLSLNFSEVPPFGDLGFFVAFGVGAAFLLSVTFLPALLSLLPIRARESRRLQDRMMSVLGEFVVRRRGILLVGSVLVVAALVSSIHRNELNDVFLHYFDESIEFRRDSDFTIENLTGLYAMEYHLPSSSSGGISDPKYLADVDAFAEWYRQQPETMHVSVITDTFRQLNKSMNGDDPSEYRLPESRELAAQYLLLYELSLPIGLDLNNQIDVDKSATRMVVAVQTLSSNEVLELDTRAMDWLGQNTTHIRDPNSAGTSTMFANLGRRNIVAMLFGTTMALIGVSIILVLALKSWRLGLVSLVPNLAPGAMGFGIWGLMVGEVGVSLSMVSAMTLGIVVDDTVHFLSRYKRARTEFGYSSTDAVRSAFFTVGQALLTTSLILVAGFIVVSFSSFTLNSGMGKLTALVIALALIADFFLLPPLLMKFDAVRNREARPSTSSP